MLHNSQTAAIYIYTRAIVWSISDVTQLPNSTNGLFLQVKVWSISDVTQLPNVRMYIKP